MNIHYLKQFFEKYLMKKYVELVFYWPRSRHMTQLYKNIIKINKDIPPLSKSEIKDIKSYWGKYGVKVDINCYRYYYYTTGIHDYHFVQDSILQTKIENYFIDQYLAYKLDDKNMYDVYFKDSGFILPKTLLHKIDGSYLDNDYNFISPQEAINRCKNTKTDLIIKQSVDSLGGHGISFCRVSEDISKLKSILDRSNNIVIQEVITQHPFYKSINPSSLNTVRIMSAIFKNEIVIVSSVLRMGAPDSNVDNFSSGGYMCGVKPNGCLRKFGFKSDGSKFSKHPNGFVYDNKKLPGYDNCVKLINKNAHRFMKISKLIAWDFSIDKDENPVLIEVNLSHVHVQFNQLANGPIFGDKTDEFITEILK